ncbi:MAG TPA: 50S ribosomal protein L30 [Deltaproteobacteria bacterium]|nr:MAG: 50S ribosomal protein L30 [Deltaproteobacteria bacterium GWA2_45_12]HBF13595.1 50S ribosomal protein L30 [Deltaproteobacteria bacterium]
MSQNKKMKIKLVHSVAGCNVRQRQTVKGLGLTKINQVKEIQDTPALRGMVRKVVHLVSVL